jgi:predicted AAA+ superfamily ATPase
VKELPDYQRPIVAEVLADLADIPQVISITGPRRVGKSTAVKHVIRYLIDKQQIDPQRILYFSFDDPEIFASEEVQRIIFDLIVGRIKSPDKINYFFLDEIQRLPRWELSIKKHYDLRQPIRFIVSGSASSPIFRKSQESLLGRVKDRHLLPFSFREYCQYRLRNDKSFSQILADHKIRPFLLSEDSQGIMKCVMRLHDELKPLHNQISRAVIDYCREGGFPEVWGLPDHVRKIEYLMEQQVRKVLYEDLMTLTQYRKPENVLRFFVYLLANPGTEINTTKIASEAGVERRVVEDNLPRLEITDLIMRIQKFTHKPLRVRQGNIKCYPVDMALRNAVLKTWTIPDATMMGLYAENLVVRELIGWSEKVEVSYFREKNREVDFIVTYGGNKYLPVEVKGGNATNRFVGLELFMNRYNLDFGVVITRDRTPRMEKFLYMPLRYFLLAT